MFDYTEMLHELEKRRGDKITLQDAFEALDELNATKPNIELSESFSRIGGHEAFITDSPYDIRNMLINKPAVYRFMYDPVLDKYIIGDGYSYTHIELIDIADEENYYAGYDDEIESKYGSWRHYLYGCREDEDLDDASDTPVVTYMGFYPKDNEDANREELDSKYSFDYAYTYSFGTVYTRGHKLEECELYEVLKKHFEGTKEINDVAGLNEEVDHQDELGTKITKTEFGDKVDFYDGNTYIGTASTATVEKKDDFVYNVEVEQSHRGKGYGTWIMRWMMSHYPIDLLNVAKNNTIAKALYKKLGFKKECNVRMDDNTVGDRMRLIK